MDEEVTYYLTKLQLLDIGGKDWKAVLEDLVSVGILKSFENVVALTFDKAKAIHIQSVLEFYNTKNIQTSPTKTGKPQGE